LRHCDWIPFHDELDSRKEERDERIELLIKRYSLATPGVTTFRGQSPRRHARQRYGLADSSSGILFGNELHFFSRAVES
jgi:hypothetical protein